MSQTKFQSAVLIGYGSIGAYHARILNELYERVAVVDKNPTARDACKATYPNVTTVSDLTELAKIDWPWHQTLGVIATWGISHSTIFHQLIGLGVRKILCEKPLAHSMKAGAEMVKAAKEHNVAFANHIQRQYSGFVESLQKKAAKLEMGLPCAMVVQGGASGLVTNGIHYLALANSLFGKAPDWVSSTAEGLPINPRSPNLMFFGGTATWSYGQGRELTMTMTNLSSISLDNSIYYRDAKVRLLRNLEIEIGMRDPEQLKQYPVITRLGGASVEVATGSLPGVINGEECTKLMIQEIEAGEIRIYPPESALDTLSACIGALSSGKTGERIALPMDPNSELGCTEWPIS